MANPYRQFVDQLFNGKKISMVCTIRPVAEVLVYLHVQISQVGCNVVPNQPHLLKKYQINMGFSHFHEFGILSGIYILAPYQIDIVKGCGFCNGNIILT